MSQTNSGCELHVDLRLPRDRFTLSIDETIDLHEPLAVYGPSGSGKTSLLRAIAGLEPDAHGTLRFGSEHWQSNDTFVAPHLRRIGYVFQDARLFAHLSVGENLRLAARIDDARQKPIIDALRLAPLLERSTAHLSGGESQRVAIARALLTEPRLLLMDEPLASLDSATRRELTDYVGELTWLLSIPLIYVTHDAGEVARLCPNTMMLGTGRVRSIGKTSDVFASESAFDDAVSILEATVGDSADNMCRLNIGNQHVQVPAATFGVAGSPVRIRIFADDVVLARRRIEETSIRNILQGTVIDLRDVNDIVVEVQMSIEGQSLRARITRSAIAETGFAPGDEVFAMIKSVALSDTIRRSAQ